MANTPDFLQDAAQTLTEQGFVTSNVWYHGTSSALLESIKQQGLVGSGDKAMKAATKQTMATIGNEYSESKEPVFLTPSKELAYYWAEQTVRSRGVRLGSDEQPVVLEANLPDELASQVKPDVGAASLLLVPEGEAYMAFLAEIYERNGLGTPNIDLMKADRLEYLSVMGMAYSQKNIDAKYLSEVISGAV